MKEKEELERQTTVETASDQLDVSAQPMDLKVIIREFKKDKVAIFALSILAFILVTTFASYIRLDASQVMSVDILRNFAEPEDFNCGLVADAWNGEKSLIFGADEYGRDVFMQLFLAAGNSILIAFAVTTIIAVIGITLGLIAGYYGGQVDNVIMRITDFVMTLPTTMIIIVFLVVVPEYTITSFIFIISIFACTGYTRIVRMKDLSESRLDYIDRK